MSGTTVAILVMLCILARGGNARTPQRRKAKFSSRLDMDEYIEKYRLDPDLVRQLRMPIESFNMLVSLLKEPLMRNKKMADLRGGLVDPSLCVFCMLRYLSGGKYLDVMRLAGVSRATFYRIVWLTIDALILCEDRTINNIHFPSTEEDCKDLAEGFAGISFGDAITNCVSVHDGYLLEIITPSSDAVGNVRTYFSGHYQCYGINVQASCDSKCRFTYIAVAGPGVMADRDAIDQCSLGAKISNLPFPYVSIGDAAYTVSEKLVAIFFGHRRTQARYDNFNFFASQLRIRIEMAFGLMTAKWGILKQPLRIKVTKIWKLVVAIARLHNFCINQRLSKGIVEAETSVASVNPSTPQAADGTPIVQDNGSIFSQLRPANVMGESATREWMVNEIAKAGLARPRRS